MVVATVLEELDLEFKKGRGSYGLERWLGKFSGTGLGI